MLKPILAASALVLCLVVSAPAQSPPPDAEAMMAAASRTGADLPAVDSMSCDQMMRELMADGQTMNSQMDPEFGTEAQAMMGEMQSAQRQAMGQMALCMIPGMGMVCALGSAANAGQAQQQHMAREQAQVDRLNDSMSGLDQERMMSVSHRFEEQHCQDQMQGAQ